MTPRVEGVAMCINSVEHFLCRNSENEATRIIQCVSCCGRTSSKLIAPVNQDLSDLRPT